jgi:hypothetical protein
MQNKSLADLNECSASWSVLGCCHPKLFVLMDVTWEKHPSLQPQKAKKHDFSNRCAPLSCSGN